MGDTVDTGRIDADDDGGVLTLRISVAERAGPRRISIDTGSQRASAEIDSATVDA